MLYDWLYVHSSDGPQHVVVYVCTVCTVNSKFWSASYCQVYFIYYYLKVVLESERRCRQELQAMRERHRSRFVEATAKLRSQYKSLAKRSRALESQLSRNSVSYVWPHTGTTVST